jgi:uncharacterized protein (UPF0332 family)
MKPEAADYLGKARQCLDEARQIAALMPLYHIIAREAYLAAYHAAGAYIFERTGRTAKRHRGLRSEFARLARSEPRIGRGYLTFLAEAYEYKGASEQMMSEGSRRVKEVAAEETHATGKRGDPAPFRPGRGRAAPARRHAPACRASTA